MPGPCLRPAPPDVPLPQESRGTVCQRAALYAARAAQKVKEVAQDFVKAHGFKRGLWLFGKWVGGERRARGLYTGEAKHVLAGEYLAALDAQRELARQRAAELRLEVARLEALATEIERDADPVPTNDD